MPRSDAAQRAAGEPPKPEVDPCLPEAGKPPPAALTRKYEGVLARARCAAEIDVVMRGVSQALGVDCKYCHLEGDYQAETERKRIANYMAAELVPRLASKDRREITCRSCHAGVAKILGSPRSQPRALEWMTATLVEDFVTRDGQPLRCKSCHGANWGSAEFRTRVILTDALSGLPRAPLSSP
jgi:hypothetical protein